MASLGIDREGKKQVLGFREGASEKNDVRKDCFLSLSDGD